MFAQSNGGASSDEPFAKRPGEHVLPAQGPAPSMEPGGGGSGALLRPRVTLSGLKSKSTVEEYANIVQELFGKLEGVKYSCKMFYYEAVSLTRWRRPNDSKKVLCENARPMNWILGQRRSSTLFLRRAVVLRVDVTNVQLTCGPAWPEEHDWDKFIEAVEGKSRG